MIRFIIVTKVLLTLLLAPASCLSVQPSAADLRDDRPTGAYVIVDTGQDQCYDNSDAIACPGVDAPYHGQDAQYDGNAPSYTLSGDGITVLDNNTGLTWQRTPDTDGDGDLDSDDKLTWTEWQSYPATLNAQSYGGFSDWRIPTIKELYSLIDFSGIDPSGYQGDPSGLVPFIDTGYFDFVYGDESAGERIIDAQYWSGTEYVGTVFDGQPAVFGVNFADGRIKGYPRDQGPGGPMTQFARCVRGNTDYGTNEYVDNGDGTITDLATGLMWTQNDSGIGYNWEEALNYAENLEFASYEDWHLPNAKELQSIVDYTRSPSTTGTPAIDPIFNSSSIIDELGETNYPFYWSSTTHANWTAFPGAWGAYVAFGEALGYFGPPGHEHWTDVHGAGAQRSDPKSGDPADWPYGNGPQGDAVRIYNYVRCVRNAEPAGDVDDRDAEPASDLGLRTTPNPTHLVTSVEFNLARAERVRLDLFDVTGARIRTLLEGTVAAGVNRVVWDGTEEDGHTVPSGIYMIRLRAGERSLSTRLLVIR
jgi:hypothetical protein